MSVCPIEHLSLLGELVKFWIRKKSLSMLVFECSLGGVFVRGSLGQVEAGRRRWGVVVGVPPAEGGGRPEFGVLVGRRLKGKKVEGRLERLAFG